MAAALAKERDEQVRCTVDHAWRVEEIVSAVHHSQQLDDAADAVEVADLRLQRGETGEHTQLRRLVALLNRQVTAELARHGAALRPARAVAGDEDEVARPH